MTVLEVLTAASGYLEKRDVENPRLNAEHLLAHVLGKKRLDLYLEFDRPLSDAERAPLRDLIRRRGERVPLQHLLGTAEFFGRSFLCDARGLIPRPETEQLVELVLQSKIQNPKSKILDVGTGSGVIAITLARELPEAEIHAIDVSPAALSLSRENAERLGVAERVVFHEGDLLPSGATTFACIVANLPYIATGELAALQKEVRFDPAGALDGGPDGLDLVRRLSASAPARLEAGGMIAFEIGHDQAARTAEELEKHGYAEIIVHRDYQDIERFVTARRGGGS